MTEKRAMASESYPPRHDEQLLQLEISTQTAANAIAGISKKPPPGTWTPLETSNLIEAYAEKWYALRRGQLRSQHWEEVALALAARCAGLINCVKTSVQCRHKMEKLRRKYRAERQIRLRRGGHGHAHASAEAWPYFERLDLMERGPSSSVALAAGYGAPPVGAAAGATSASGGTGFGFVKGRKSTAPFLQNSSTWPKRLRRSRGKEPEREVDYQSLDEDGYDSDLPPPDRHQQNQQGRREPLRKDSRTSEYDFLQSYKPASENRHRSPRMPLDAHKPFPASSPIAELVSVVHWLGEGLLRLEQSKLQMQRENERMRADMEARQAEMFLNSQKEIADLFATALRSSSKNSRKRED